MPCLFCDFFSWADINTGSKIFKRCTCITPIKQAILCLTGHTNALSCSWGFSEHKHYYGPNWDWSNKWCSLKPWLSIYNNNLSLLKAVCNLWYDFKVKLKKHLSSNGVWVNAVRVGWLKASLNPLLQFEFPGKHCTLNPRPVQLERGEKRL